MLQDLPTQPGSEGQRVPLQFLHLQHSFHYTKNLEIILEIIKQGSSEVLYILSYPSQKIPLILMIPTVSSSFSYLLWGMRNGSCCFLCLHAHSRNPLDVSGRMICRQKGIFKGDPTQLESWETVQWGQSYLKNKFDEQGPQGGMRSGDPNRPFWWPRWRRAVTFDVARGSGKRGTKYYIGIQYYSTREPRS